MWLNFPQFAKIELTFFDVNIQKIEKVSILHRLLILA